MEVENGTSSWKVMSFADAVTSRAISSIKTTLSLNCSFIKLLDLWVIFPEQLESSNVDICRRSYDQNAKTVQNRNLLDARWSRLATRMLSRDSSSLSRLVTHGHDSWPSHLCTLNSKSFQTRPNWSKAFSKHKLTLKTCIKPTIEIKMDKRVK